MSVKYDVHTSKNLNDLMKYMGYSNTKKVITVLTNDYSEYSEELRRDDLHRIMNLGYIEYHICIEYAVENRFTDIIRLFIENEKKYKNGMYSIAIIGASKGGHIEIVEWMLELGAKEYSYGDCMKEAAKKDTLIYYC